jgi:hypothetical protein
VPLCITRGVVFSLALSRERTQPWGFLLQREDIGQPTIAEPSEFAVVVDRAGFEPATFRTLDLEFAKRTIFGPVGIPD